jgi:hypothetical protein
VTTNTLGWRLAEDRWCDHYPVSHEMATWNDVVEWVGGVIAGAGGALDDRLIVEVSLDGECWHVHDVFVWSDALCRYVLDGTVMYERLTPMVAS